MDAAASVTPSLAAPRNPRELFQLLAGHAVGKADLSDLLEPVDFAGVTPRHVYYGVLGRPPERFWSAAPDYDAKAHFLRGLRSPEFRVRAIELFLAAFPEKRRLVFIHIPKCAGTDLNYHLARRFLWLRHILSSPETVPDKTFFAELAMAAQRVESVQEIFVAGHIQFSHYAARIGTRLNDRIFTVIRDPIEIAMSMANYVVSQLLSDPK